jgi:gliding motility-associated-like protein
LKKLLTIISFLLATGNVALADHISGGEIVYEYMGPGSGDALKYRITLKIYIDCVTGIELIEYEPYVAVYHGGTLGLFKGLNIPLAHQERIFMAQEAKCISDPPQVCYILCTYTADIELPPSADGYTLTYSNCCRTEDLINVQDPLGTGTIYTASIPGTSLRSDAPRNSSPLISSRDTVIICANSFFEYSFEAFDKENDQLSYEFSGAFDWLFEGELGPPPYTFLNYASRFSPSSPMGDKVTIDRENGLIRGVAPERGVYVITVAIKESRSGIVINSHRKDLHIRVAPCTIAEANLESEYVLCKGPVIFRNLNTSSLIKSFYWDFGVQGNADTSNEATPSFNFPDTGMYRIMLITNRNQDCSDTAVAIVKNYPGMTGKMEILGGCINTPVQFMDRSAGGYGTINYRKWYFGDPSPAEDSSELADPVYTYSRNGTYNVRLITGNTFGCRDTVSKSLVILDKPLLSVTGDTLICSLDTIRIRASGNGSVRWSPEYMMSSSSAPDPLISPDVSTMYYVTLTSSPGCINNDSVLIRVKQSVALTMPPDTTICNGDSVRLNIQSDGISFLWSPAPGLSGATEKTPTAKPLADQTTYTVVANLGACQTTGDITVKAIPYPKANAGSDTAICYGSSIKLNASGGSKYSWTGTGLSNAELADPVAQPQATTVYKLTVYDSKGCSKPSFDSVLVQVYALPKAFAGNDTIVISGQPLQLRASGGTNYFWQPASGLSNVSIAEPLATLTSDMIYTVTVSNSIGCAEKDTISIKVLLTQPDILVPTAFTPNNDRKNDILKPIPVGVTRIEFFRVYDHFGQIIFSTNIIDRGWDGRFQGRDLNGGTYVWAVQGIDYTGKKITKKGTVTLIR